MTVQRPSPRPTRPVHAIVLALVLAATLSVVCGPESRAEHRGRGVTLVGLVEQLPESGLIGEWRVAGRTVVVGTETTIDERRAPVTIGALVDVRGTVDARGTITAQTITVKAGGQQPISCTFAVVHLQPTGTTLPDAEGVVVAREFVRADGSTREDLRVGVQGLAPETAYEVVFDGITAGSIETCDEGEGHLFLSTAEVPGAGVLPPELSPVTGLHEAAVLDPTGVAVLAGSFADARREACGQPSLDYLAVAMLRNDDGHPAGLASAWSKDGVERLDLFAGRFAPSAEVRVVVDTIEAGTAVASATGHVRVVFSTSPGPDELPLPEELRPVSGLVHVELLAADGAVLAAGDLRPVAGMTPGIGGGPVRPKLGR